MTQALNLANFANNLNTSGQASNSGLQNSSVTVTAGTGMSGGGAVSLGGTVTLTNAGVTSVIAGSGISISSATGDVTITASGGGVTSLNGQTGAITNTSTNTIGSYFVGYGADATAYSYGSTVAGSSLTYANSASFGGFSVLTAGANNSSTSIQNQSSASTFTSAGLSGTWRCMTYGGSAPASGYRQTHLWVRVS